MAKPRNVVVFTWDGPVVVQRLGRADPDPTSEELEGIASAWLPSSGGVKPSVRIIESMPVLRAHGVGSSGPAGSLRR